MIRVAAPHRGAESSSLDSGCRSACQGKRAKGDGEDLLEYFHRAKHCYFLRVDVGIACGSIFLCGSLFTSDSATAVFVVATKFTAATITISPTAVTIVLPQSLNQC